MVIVQKRSQRKASGARYKDTLTKRLAQKGHKATHTGIEKRRVVARRVQGGNLRNKTLSADSVNVYDASKKKHVQAKIKTVAENAANRHFIRRNIVTKGAIVETDLGKVKISNRPGQEGSLNGVKVD